MGGQDCIPFSKDKSPPLQGAPKDQDLSTWVTCYLVYRRCSHLFFCHILPFSGMIPCTFLSKFLAMKELGLVMLFQIFISVNGDSPLSLFDQCSNTSCFFPNGFLVRYPFGAAKGCGHPDFQVDCNGTDFPSIKINGVAYRVNKVSYPEQTLRVVDEAAISSYCYLPNANLNDTGRRFQMLPHSTLVFFLHCTRKVQNYSHINCSENSYLVFADDEGQIGKAINSSVKSNCMSVFQVPAKKLDPVDYTTRLIGDQYSSKAIKILIDGFGLKWDVDSNYGALCRVCNLSQGVCGYNASDPHPRFLCHCRNGLSHPQSCSHESSNGRAKLAIIASCVGGFSALVATAALYIILWIRKKRIANKSMETGSTDFGLTERDIHIPNLPEFTYQELQQATDLFDKNRELGDGGFGTVYLGKLNDGRTVAVKKLHENNSKRLEQFVNEARILSSVRHPNLVRLFGYCHERQNLLLIYEYVPNGTLFHHLHGRQTENGTIYESLPWKTRLNIALETANALAYLHFSVEPAIYHRDVKSTNILLDENLHVKVADFGLSRLMALESTHISTVPQGTPGYLDPGYYQSFQLTEKSDVYSFGVVLIELISGKKAVDTARDIKEIGLAHLAISKIQSGALHEIVDPDFGFEREPLVKAMVTGVAELAFICLALEKDDRPCMMEVVTQLHRIKQMGYGCPDCQGHVLGSKAETICGRIDKLVLPFSPDSVQAKWPSTSPSPQLSK